MNRQVQLPYTVLEGTVYNFSTFLQCIVLLNIVTEECLHMREFIQYCSNNVTTKINKRICKCIIYCRAVRSDCIYIYVCLRVSYVVYLSSQACPGGGEVDFGHHWNSVRGDKGGRIPCCQEETEVLVVVNNLVSYLNHISWTCVCVCAHVRVTVE